MSICVRDVSKYYGKQKALNNINFDLNTGEIVGFLGPNGAGKSTLLKILSGYITTFSGEVSIVEKDIKIQKKAIQKITGYLPENNPLYEDLYIVEYLKFVAGIYKVNKNRIAEVIEEVGLSSEKQKKIRQLSKGYRQRVGLAAAILPNPKVLLLDEPTTGLDPNQLIEIRNLIKKLSKNTTILFSTHILSEVYEICNRVLILNKGNLVGDFNLSNLKKENKSLEELFTQLTLHN
ncbi:MAG: ATP-binding cassette domain-containing protein [Lutibacter sp.]